RLRVYRPAAPPIPPLFPYTTLFRSRATLDTGDPVYVVVDTPGISARSHATALATYPSQALMEGAKRTQVYRLDPSRLLPAKRGEDRKSTRLNSSHVKISYAVFCLNK